MLLTAYPPPRVAPEPVVQCSLRVGSVSDPLEVEADRVAERVVGSDSVGVVRRCPGGCPGDEELRRSPTDDGGFEDEEELLLADGGGSGGVVGSEVAAGVGAVRGGGVGLSESVRGFFEPRFGADFSGVRVHADGGAAGLAASVNARAFTVGSDVFFGAGEFRPGTRDGDRLLAHELTHTLQQASTGVLRRQTDPRPSPEEDFVRDLQTGTEQVAEYVEYVTQAVEYWRRHGTRPGRLDDALRNIQTISTRVSAGLARFRSVLGIAERAVQIRDWFEEASDFAAATRALDWNDRATVRRWANSMEGLRQRSAPFVEAAREWLARLARRGSGAAARGAFFLSVLSAYVEVGSAALRAGIGNVNAYIDRREQIIEEIFDAERGVQRRVPPEPRYPGDWVPAAEERRRSQARADYERRARQRRAEELRARQAMAEFDSQVFPTIYQRHRRRLKWRILRDMKRGRPVGIVRLPSGVARVPGLPAQRWWDQLIDSGRAPYFDHVAGHNITPKADRVTPEQAADEIDRFQRVRPRCPYFDDLYSSELEEFLRTRAGQARP